MTVVVSGHQPAYLPWLGLLHKASLADVFVYMDDVQYLERDWNNRNRIKTPQGGAQWLTVPVDRKNSASDVLKDIRIADEQVAPARSWQARHWRAISQVYGKAPHFGAFRGFFEWLYLEKRWERLSDLNLAILRQVFEWFGIGVKLVVASGLGFTGKKSDLVLEHGLRFKADVVLTGVNGAEYIDTDAFAAHGIGVEFQNYEHPVYEQPFGGFVSHLSFIDLLMNHGPQAREICMAGNLTREELCRRHSC